jgi:hypothetical protein
MIISVCKFYENEGTKALESLIELTQKHGEIWSGCVPKLIEVVSEIINLKHQFIDVNRFAALEIIVTLSEKRPALLRKHA